MIAGGGVAELSTREVVKFQFLLRAGLLTKKLLITN